jgi:hypothetical protein
MKSLAWVLLACFFVSGAAPVFARGEIDLVALKKQEEERRKKIAKSKQVITDANVNAITSGGRSYGFVQMESEAPPAEATIPEAPVAGEPANEQKQPDFWKKQQVELETRIAELKDGIQVEQTDLSRLWSEFYIKNIPSEQAAIRAQISQLTNQLEQNKLFLSESERQLVEFLEKARKAGVPPGWLR